MKKARDRGPFSVILFSGSKNIWQIRTYMLHLPQNLNLKPAMRLHCCIFSLLIAVSCLAQGRRTFDIVYDAFDSGIAETDLWDATRLGVLNNRSKAYGNIGISGIYSEHLDNFDFLYLLRGDSLFYRGYTCGRGEGLINDSLTIALKRPFECSKRHASFVQRGLRDDVRLKTITEFESEVIGRGRFVRSVADTLSNVFLVREKHVVRESLAESETPLNDYVLEFYRWYTESDSLPVAVQFSISGDDFDDAALYVSEYAAVSDADKADNGSDMASILSNAVVSQNESEIKIDFESDTEFEVEVWLVDTYGHSYGYARHQIGEECSIVQIPISSLPRGTYMLVIPCVDGLSVTEKRMLTL